MFKKNDYFQNIQRLLSEKYQNELTKKAQRDIEKLKKGEPLDYLIGFINFLGCRIDLSKRPFIPRVETEFWVGKLVRSYQKQAPAHLKCLDIFAGSGCLGIAVLSRIPGARVDFSEKSLKFLRQVKINLELNKISQKRYHLIKSDIFSEIRGKYDLILANPPYVPWRQKDLVQESVWRFEPKSAIFGGLDGLSHIRSFLEEAKKYLKPKGKIYLEFGFDQRIKLKTLLESFAYKHYRFFKDLYGRWRYLIISNT